MNSLKQSIYQHISDLLDSKIEEINQLISSGKESRDSDTKSSAGDKHETSRAMIQIEMENNQKQLNKNAALKTELSKINLDREYTSVDFGSLVVTNNGNYFIAIGIGQVKLDNEVHYSISLASPIGALLKGKQKGDSITFNGNQIEILDIY